MFNDQDFRDRASGQSARRRIVRFLMAATMLLLAGCAIQPLRTPTPLPATPTERRVGATPSTTPSPTAAPPTQAQVTPTATSQPTTATPAPPTPTPTPTPRAPSPTPFTTATPTPVEPRIHAFRANVDVADPGDTVTLSWDWSGGREATIYHLLPSGQLSLPQWDVGPTGSLQYTISPEARNYDTFALFVYDEEGLAAQDTLQIELRCPDAWFFSPAPDVCPAGPPLITDGAEEHFERGTMLWVRAEDRIYVLFSDEQYPRWTAYRDEWDEGEPSMDPTIDPPPGLEQPVRGFGLLWRQEPTVRERLGWAVDQEQGYQTALQRTSHYRYPDLYIRALDGGVWRLGPNGSSWQYVATQ